MAESVAKKVKGSEECCASRGETSCEGNMSSDFTQLRLLTLPSEVLERIFSYLEPLSIVNIRKLGFVELTECTFRLKKADFSLCNRIGPEELKAFFCTLTVQRITKINLNGVFFVPSKILKTCIIKCKELTVLSVEECGLSLPQIVDICESCPNLEELCLSISNYLPLTFKKCPSVKKLHLNCAFMKTDCCNLRHLRNYIKIFPKVAIVYLNYSPYYFLCVPYNNDCVQLMEAKYENKPVIVNIFSVFQDSFPNFVDAQCLIQPVWISEEFKGTFNFQFLPAYTFKDSICQQFWTPVDEFDSLPSRPDNSVSSLVLNVAMDTAQDSIKRAKKLTGKRLEHLAMNGFAPCIPDFDRLLPMVDSIPEILLNAANISVLNMSIMHFENTLPLSCLQSLKSLKILSMPGCAISNQKSGDQTKQFENFVINCKNVEKFSLSGCKDCRFGPNDAELAPIHKWRSLTSLSLIRLATLRICYFLVHVANSCPDFQSLEIVAIGVNSVCHYIPSIISVLKWSSKLKLLRINESGFYPMESIFWKAVKSAKNLEGLCLSSSCRTAVSTAMIIEAIAELPYLHLFHLTVEGTCENLVPKLKCLMKQHEIQSFSICVGSSNHGPGKIQCIQLHFVI